jgi:[protein-PII] uridylyltransferase
MPIDAGAGMRAELLALLREGSAASWASFERSGLLDRHLPELARLRAEVRGRQGGRPWERLAAFAGHLRPGADQAAAAAWRALPDPDGLLLACLVRAVGDRAGTGRVRHVAERTAERLGLGPAASQAVARLAAEEVDLAELAVDVDPHDEEQVLRLAARLAGPQRVRAAYLLALAEQEPGGGRGWRRAQLDELLRVVLAAMAEPGLTDRAAEDLLRRRRAEVERVLRDRDGGRAAARLAAAPRRYLLAQPADAVARHLVMAEPTPGRRELRLAVTPEEPGAWRIDVVTRDRPGLLAGLAGALSAAGVDVTRAQASTWPDDLVVDVFHVAGPSPQAEPGFAGRVGRMLHAAVAGDPQPGRLLADRAAQAQARSGPVVVRVDADAAPWHSSVRVEAPDRLGLLYEILLELARHHVDVQVARVGSEAGRAVDLFLVTDAAGRPLERAAADRLGTALADRLAGRPALR